MSQKLVALNPDLKRLRDDGYSVTIRSGLLIVDLIPYVNERREVAYGTLVSELTLAGEKTQPPGTHVINFIGEHPCDPQGQKIGAIVHNSGKNRLADNVVVDHSFSNKPAAGYKDYYEKITTYAKVISHQAQAIDSSATPMAFAPIAADQAEDDVFNYLDTATSRAGIGAANSKLLLNQIAIIGLGGSGSYVLDLLAKTPVKEIHLFDGDDFLQHNAFRAPGAPTLEELQGLPKKVQYFASKYGAMRRGIVPHDNFASRSDEALLASMQFVFICMDAGLVKREIIEVLEANGVPFIDVGMGIELADHMLTGIVRVTLSKPDNRERARKRISFGGQGPDAAYASNIQVADLNALTAVLAVIQWKKLFGFYFSGVTADNLTYLIGGNELIKDDED